MLFFELNLSQSQCSLVKSTWHFVSFRFTYLGNPGRKSVKKPPDHQRLLCEKLMPVVNGTLYAKCKTKWKQTKKKGARNAEGSWKKTSAPWPQNCFLATILLYKNFNIFFSFCRVLTCLPPTTLFAGCKRLVANNWQLPKCRQTFSSSTPRWCTKKASTYPHSRVSVSAMWLRWLVILFKSLALSSPAIQAG